MKEGVVTIRLIHKGKIVHVMHASTGLGFTEYAPGGVKSYGDESLGMVYIPNPVEIDEVAVVWPLSDSI